MSHDTKYRDTIQYRFFTPTCLSQQFASQVSSSLWMNSRMLNYILSYLQLFWCGYSRNLKISCTYWTQQQIPLTLNKIKIEKITEVRMLAGHRVIQVLLESCTNVFFHNANHDPCTCTWVWRRCPGSWEIANNWKPKAADQKRQTRKQT